VTAQPFCTGIGPGDTRINTRYDEYQFSDAFFGILHAAGHVLYEQVLPAEHFSTSMGEAVSLGIRVAATALGECRWAEPGLLDVLVCLCPAGLSSGSA